jgi:hypothetical protein
VEAGALNGQWLDPDSVAVTVAPGEIVVGYLDVAYRVISGNAAVLAAAVPVWGDRRENHFPLHAMYGGRGLVRERWALRFRAPERPGRYLLFVVASFETAAEFIASGTNWALRRPIWFDGSDVADVGPPQAERVRRTGRLSQELILPDLGFRELLTNDEIEAAVRAGRVARGVTTNPALVIEVVVSDGRRPMAEGR